MPLPEKNLQAAINNEVVTPKPKPAVFARRLERNFDELDKRVTAVEGSASTNASQLDGRLDTWDLVKDFGTSYITLDSGSVEWVYLEASAGFGLAAFATYTTPIKQIYLDPADYGTVTGKTAYLRIRGWANVNGTDPALDVAFKLKPITFGGGADTLTSTLGSQAGNTATITNANLGTSETEKAESAAFAVPTAGIYTVTVTPSATLANNAAINIGAVLERRWQ